MDPIARWLALPVRERARILRKAMPQPAWASLRERLASIKEEDWTPIQRDAVIHLMTKGAR